MYARFRAYDMLFLTHTCTFASDLYITQVLLFSKPTERKTDNACPILFNGLLPVHTQIHTHTLHHHHKVCVRGCSCRCHWSVAGSLYGGEMGWSDARKSLVAFMVMLSSWAAHLRPLESLLCPHLQNPYTLSQL